MRISELRGYRSDPARAAASDAFKPINPNQRLGRGLARQEQLKKFAEFMAQNGFRSMGRGYYGEVFEKPGYPWVFKVFRDDAAYLRFITYAARNQDNPNLPKVKGLPMRIAPDTYVVRIEKLSPIDGQHKELASLLYDLGDAEEDDELSSEMAWLGKRYPGIRRFISMARKAWPDLSLDIHHDNIMLRGAIPVLSDPVSG